MFCLLSAYILLPKRACCRLFAIYRVLPAPVVCCHPNPHPPSLCIICIVKSPLLYPVFVYNTVYGNVLAIIEKRGEMDLGIMRKSDEEIIMER